MKDACLDYRYFEFESCAGYDYMDIDTLLEIIDNAGTCIEILIHLHILLLYFKH